MEQVRYLRRKTQSDLRNEEIEKTKEYYDK
jgi:hypothetical protein